VFRFLALVWDSADRQASDFAAALGGRVLTSPRWRSVLRTPGMHALCAGERVGSSEALVLPGDAGVVFGKLFTAVGAIEAERIASTSGRQLVERHWGRYVAILREGAGHEVTVLRDPSGALPCFFVVQEGAHVFFSDVQDCLASGLGPFTVNWKYVAAFVAYPALQIRATGLNEVSELQAGERIRVRNARARRDLVWNPAQIACNGVYEDFNEAVAATRSTVRTCVEAWARCYRGVVLGLSGGLDSSIVLSCLRRALPTEPLTCFHYHASSRDTDERRYARRMAEHARARLIECEVDASRLRLEPLLGLRRSPRPWFYIHELERGEIDDAAAAEAGAAAILTGAGGDSLFYQSRADLAVADFLRRRGPVSQLASVALDAARITRRSIWSLLGGAIRHCSSRQRRNPFAEALRQRALVTVPAAEHASRPEELLLPWLECSDGLEPGKAWQILSLSLAQAFYDSFGREEGPERANPLMSQPLVELALRIPTWLCIQGGRDRAVARRAFEAELPVEIVRRGAKGAINDHSRESLDRNLPFVRDLLLDGLLVRERILDRGRLKSCLTRGRLDAGLEYNEILHEHLCTEAWLRSWQRPGAVTRPSALPG
jgi:asparagine synthase (glutamine-hydrolysing)